jgi:outer membrane receptor protein involved in Fe transport
MKLGTFLPVGAMLLGAVAPAAAQEDSDPGEITDIEVPTLVLDDGGTEGPEESGDIDLANIVQSAARSVTTVQEAPAIVTVITEDEIKERRAKKLDELIDSAVPGFYRVGFQYGQFPHAAPRGQVQAVNLLHDGISMFEPFVNVATMHQVQPIELFKRIEVVTGPGGVLWGANSLLGIINVITKDAEDVDGVESGVDFGHGSGERKYFHGYVMAGKTNLFNDSSKLLVHGAFTTVQGQATQLPGHIFSQPLPNPNSPDFYGPLVTGEPPQTFMFSAFAKLTMGKTQIRVSVPFVERYLPAGFPGNIARDTLPDDSRPECQTGPVLVPGDGCTDKDKQGRESRIDAFERYAVIEYRTRIAGGKAGISAKASAVQFVRKFSHLAILPPTEGLLEGGLAFGFDATTYRPGVALDGDVEIGRKSRFLWGIEGFREFALNNVTEASRQGPGIAATFHGPYQLERLPVPCPREPDPDRPGMSRFVANCPLTFASPSDRTVFGAYLSPEVRPTKDLILGIGARLQVSPESLSTNPYKLTPTFGASAVYGFAGGKYHLKGQLTQGFRPPVFNNVNSNGEAMQLDGSRNLRVETSDGIQGELNGRVFKGERRIRELDFRVDYSYTRLRDLVYAQSGRYVNSAPRGINSAEALATLYIQGGHKLQLGYTWLNVATSDKGTSRNIPENWFNLLAVFNLVDGKLTGSTNLSVTGAMEDPNRLVEYRNLHYCQPGEMLPSGTPCVVGNIVVEGEEGAPYLVTQPTDLVLDRIPPTARLMLGLTYTPSDRLTFTADVFNAFGGYYYDSDIFGDYEPRLEFVPNPSPGFRAYVSAAYAY